MLMLHGNVCSAHVVYVVCACKLFGSNFQQTLVFRKPRKWRVSTLSLKGRTLSPLYRPEGLPRQVTDALFAAIAVFFCKLVNRHC